VLYLPPYSPDLNPIEKAWAKINSASAPLGPEAKRTSTKPSPKPSLSSLPTMLKHGSDTPCKHYRNYENALIVGRITPESRAIRKLAVSGAEAAGCR